MTKEEKSNLSARVKIGIVLSILETVETNMISKKEFSRIIQRLVAWHIELASKEPGAG